MENVVYPSLSLSQILNAEVNTWTNTHTRAWNFLRSPTYASIVSIQPNYIVAWGVNLSRLLKY